MFTADLKFVKKCRITEVEADSRENYGCAFRDFYPH